MHEKHKDEIIKRLQDAVVEKDKLLGRFIIGSRITAVSRDDIAMLSPNELFMHELKLDAENSIDKTFKKRLLD